MSVSKQQTIPFSTVLASTVHDMKNALSLILISLGEITEKLNEVDPDDSKVSVLRYEASRVNGLLVQLLALYKSEQQQLPLNINYHNVYDFLEEQVLSHDDLLKSKNIDVSIEVEDDLEWAFDSDLMATVVSNIITNNIRYTESTIVLSSSVIDNMLTIAIADNGAGYPDIMIDNQNDVILGIDQSTGSTGLGLYFAAQVAAMHNINNNYNDTYDVISDKNTANTLLSNSENGGGIFTIRIH